MPRIYKRKRLSERFFEKVKKTDGCWLWTASVNNKGYGQFFWQRSPRIVRLAHRVSWELHDGFPLPNYAYVLHRCDNPICVRPSHLFLGSPQDNMDDCVSKGRNIRGSRMRTAKLNEENVKDIRKRYTGRRGEINIIAKEYGVSRELIGMVVRRKWWKHV